MKWIKKTDYYIESIGNSVSFSISKSKVCDVVLYELWRLPYNNAECIFGSENLEDVKHKAIQYYKEQSTNAGGKAA